MPRLSYNVLSVSNVTEAGKTTKFDDTCCRITGEGGKLLAMATKVGSRKVRRTSGIDKLAILSEESPKARL